MDEHLDLQSLAKETPVQPPTLSGHNRASPVTYGEHRSVSTSTVTTNPLNQRPGGEDEDIEQLAATIREYGTIQPLLVCSTAAFLSRFPNQRAAVGDSHWVTLIGNRRLLASRRVPLERVDVVLNDERVASMYKAMLIENGQRRELPPLNEARAMAEAMEEETLSQRDLARQIGKSEGFVSQRLALLKLIPQLADALESGDLPLEVARAVGDLPAEQQQEIARAGKPYRRPGPQSVLARRPRWAANPTSAASAIQEKFDPEELAELVRLLTEYLKSLSE
jgi:ParB family chromosome partitioning protein